MNSPNPIAALRASLGFSPQEVALMARLSVKRLNAIERGAEPLAEEADALTALLGADLESLLLGETQPRPLASLLKGQAKDLDAATRFGLAEAMTVAREVQGLNAMLGLPVGLGRVATFTANGDYGHPKHGVPERLARTLRKELNLGTAPVGSVTAQILEPLGIVTLWLAMPETIDAVAMATEETGAVIVANPRGSHMQTAYGRRVAFTHEVCHILYDRPQMPRFARACAIEGEPKGQEREWFESVERRARAFALALLAPRDALETRWTRSASEPVSARVQDVMGFFGIGYEAARAHLHNQSLLPLSDAVRVELKNHVALQFEQADPPPRTPQNARSWLRGGHLAGLAEQAALAGRISSRRAAELARGPLQVPEAWSPNPSTAAGFRTASMGTTEAENLG